MGNLKFGTYSPTALYMGASGSTKAYLGTTEVFSGGSIDYSKEYLTFDIVSAGTITYSNTHYSFIKTISYSVNNSEWLSGSSFSLNVNSGDKIRFKGTNTAYNNSYDYRCGFGGTATFNIVGNILSLTYGDNFTGNTEISANYAFSKLFSGTSVISAENLILPNNATTRCYYGTFMSCTLLTTAPKLPAATLNNYSYYYMFRGDSSLSYIECLATNISASSCLGDWLYGVAATGTFVKDPNMSSWPSGNSGIPNGWTVLDAS